jgi:hypothetical protein
MQEDKRRRDKLLGREMARPVTSRRNRPKTRAGEPVMAHWFSKHTALRGEYKGELFKAHIRRDGRIVCRGKIFDAPSLAAREAIGRKRAMNGWWFWRFERAPGDWVRLRELRR